MIEQKENGFYIGDRANPDAEILYEESNIVTITHTYVSENMRGQGIAEKLLNKVIEYAISKGKKILPVCSYAKKKLSKEEYKGLIVKQ